MLCVTTLVTAQSAPPSASPLPAQPDEAVELSPFEVRSNRDDKWNASSTLLGNRTNQELVKVPASVEVLTADFMRDVGVFDQEEAGAFVSGVSVTPRLEARGDGRLSWRGLSGNANTSRNFFQWAVPSDTYNVERFDFGKGSNSLLFGDMSPGGQVTTTTKRARFLNYKEAMAFTDSFGSYRFQIDLNRKLSDKLAIRFNAVNRNQKSWVAESYQRLRAVDLAVSYRPFRDTIVTVEAERGSFQRRRADNSAAITPIAAPGRGFGANNRWYVTSDGEIINRTATTPAAIDRTAPSGTPVSLLEGQSAGVLMPDGTQKIFRGLSRSFNLMGPFDFLDRPFNVVTAAVEQRVGKLSLQASYNQQFQHQDRNDGSFGSSASPLLINVEGTGRPYVEWTGNTQTYKVFGEIYKAGRIAAQYPFEFGKWMKQDLVITGTRSKDYLYSSRYGWTNTSGPGTVQNNALAFRAYLDDPAILSGRGWDRFDPNNIPKLAAPGFTPALANTYTTGTPFLEIRYTTNYTASLAGEYFGGRLNSMVGVSYNRIARKIPTTAAYAIDARGYPLFYGTPDDDPSKFTYDPGFDLSATNFNAGLTYAVLRNENVSANVYGVYSQSFNWQARVTFTGVALGPIEGTTREIGLKGDLFKGMIAYTLSAYRIERSNAGYAWSPNSLGATAMEALFNPNDLSASATNYFHVASGINNEAITVNSSEKSRGIEMSFMSRRSHGVQARLTFSRTKVEATRDFSDFTRMLNAAIARTTAATAPGGDPAMAESAASIAAAQTILASNTNTTAITGLRSAPYTGSFVVDYQFRRPAGLRIGVSGVWTPDYNIAVFNGAVYRDGHSLPVGLYATYDRKLLGMPTSFRLGVNRVYDLLQGGSAYYISGANGFDTTNNRPISLYRYTEPNSVNFSATVRF